MSDFPRRCQMQKWCEAEHKIAEAMHAVEIMGADIRLTDAVCLLGAARDRVADFVDGVEGKRTMPRDISTGAALPAEHAPPDPSTKAHIAAAKECDRQGIRISDHYDKLDAVLRAAYAVDFGGSRPALAGSPETSAPWYTTCDGCGQYVLCRIFTPTLDGTPTYNLCPTCIHNAARHQELPAGGRPEGPSAPPPSGPWRIEDEGYEDEYWMVVTGDGKPRCAHCGSFGRDYDETKFGSNIKAEAEAVRDALNRVAGSRPPEGT